MLFLLLNAFLLRTNLALAVPLYAFGFHHRFALAPFVRSASFFHSPSSGEKSADRKKAKNKQNRMFLNMPYPFWHVFE